MKRKVMLILFYILAFCPAFPASASDVTISYYYRQEQDPNIPNTLIVGWTVDCGIYTLKFLQLPVITKSNQYMVSDNETEYMVIRVAITNNSDSSAGWLAPDSFMLQDTYLGRIYGSYTMDIPVSAKTAYGFHEQVFFSEIKPHDTLYTSLVFSVYPDVKSWIFNFAPHAFGEEKPEPVRFRIPFPIIQD